MRVVRHHDAHQRAVLGRNIFIVERDVTMEPEDARVVIRPVLHFAEFHIPHDVVDAQNATVVACQWRGREARQKRPFVILV